MSWKNLGIQAAITYGICIGIPALLFGLGAISRATNINVIDVMVIFLTAVTATVIALDIRRMK